MGILDFHPLPWKSISKKIKKTIPGNVRFLKVIFRNVVPNIGT